MLTYKPQAYTNNSSYQEDIRTAIILVLVIIIIIATIVKPLSKETTYIIYIAKLVRVVLALELTTDKSY